MSTLQLQFLVLMLAGWVNRNQQDVIAYLQEENRVLREQLGGKRARFSDGQRRRLADKAKAIGRQRLFEIETPVGTARSSVEKGWEVSSSTTIGGQRAGGLSNCTLRGRLPG